MDSNAAAAAMIRELYARDRQSLLEILGENPLQPQPRGLWRTDDLELLVIDRVDAETMLDQVITLRGEIPEELRRSLATTPPANPEQTYAPVDWPAVRVNHAVLHVNWHLGRDDAEIIIPRGIRLAGHNDVVLEGDAEVAEPSEPSWGYQIGRNTPSGPKIEVVEQEPLQALLRELRGGPLWPVYQAEPEPNEPMPVSYI